MELLERLVNAFGPSGMEDEVSKVIIDEIKGFADEIKCDSMGNIIALKKGNGSGKLMLTAHMDQVGVAVTSIEDDGRIRFARVGNYGPQDIYNHRVAFKGGRSGVVACDREDDLKFENMFIDTGSVTKADAERAVRAGDFGVFKSQFMMDGTVIQSSALDNRAGCLVLIDVLKRLKSSKSKVYFVFTAREESCGGGASGAAYRIEPDMCISVDASGEKNLKLGQGASIKVMDRGIVYHHDVRQLLKNAAIGCGSSYQMEVSSSCRASGSSGTPDGYEVYTSGAGVKTGVISIPVHHIHTPGEIADFRDIESAENIILKAIECLG